jgi:hypothetical protein
MGLSDESMRDQISQVARSLRYSSNNAYQLADAIIEALFNTDTREKIEDILWDNRQTNDIDVVYIADDIMEAFTGETTNGKSQE